MMKLLKGFVKYPEYDIIKSILEDNEIEVQLKATGNIGVPFFGDSTNCDVFVPEQQYQKAIELLNEYKEGGFNNG